MYGNLRLQLLSLGWIPTMLVGIYFFVASPHQGTENCLRASGTVVRVGTVVQPGPPTLPPPPPSPAAAVHQGPKPRWGLVWAGEARKGLEYGFIKSFLLQDATVLECGRDVRVATESTCGYYWQPHLYRVWCLMRLSHLLNITQLFSLVLLQINL